MNKYINIYHKKNILWASLCAIAAFIPLFIVSLYNDYVYYDTLVSFIPFVAATIYLAIASLFPIRFKKLIKKQEILYGIKFNDANTRHLEKTLYVSDYWLIQAGSLAFHKNT